MLSPALELALRLLIALEDPFCVSIIDDGLSSLSISYVDRPVEWFAGHRQGSCPQKLLVNTTMSDEFDGNHVALLIDIGNFEHFPSRPKMPKLTMVWNGEDQNLSE